MLILNYGSFIAKQGTPVDLQDIFQRFSFDTNSKLLLDHDPKSLSVNLPHVPCEIAFSDMGDALAYRHILPKNYWKLQKWLRVGFRSVYVSCHCGETEEVDE